MTKHPTADWEFDDKIEEAFQEWFNDLCGGFSFRSEWFFGDAEVEDVKTRQDLMYKWVHASFISGWEAAKPQTPEQVDEGLLFSHTIDFSDVMDATPYLKQMTFNSDIEKTEAEIKVLQKKLDLLKEIETHKSQPKMEYQESGTVDKVEYNGHTYLRIDYDNDSWYGGVWWKQIERHKSPMNIVTDDVTRNVLEGLWYDQVKKDKPTKPMNEVVERLTKKYEAQKLYNRLFELGYEEEDCEVIVSLVEDWLPEPQSAEGSQNVDTELLVDGFNHCLQKMKEMLR